MSTELPTIYLIRHGETAWSLTGQHTGLSDLPLTTHGEQAARKLAPRLRSVPFALVLCSPLRRAVRTCELAGFATPARRDPDLCEWNYGDYEGRRTVEIRVDRPQWELFRDGCPGGESAEDVAERADRVIARVRAAGGNALLFSSGHILRVLAARWLHLPAASGRLLQLGTASLSMLGYEHDASQPVVHLWNETRR